jgi:diguanylate cyclase (GGDEF)-like protein/PAS domain S-box-containing protein
MLAELSRREQEIIRINEGLEGKVAERTRALSAINARLRNEMDAREQVLQKVENLLQRNQTLMKTAMDGIHLLDLDGNLVEASPSFCRMLGYTEAEAAGLNVADWDALWTVDNLRPKFREMIGQSILIETLHRRKDGTIFEVEIACSGVEFGGQPYVYAASRDISERKRAEVAMKQHRVILETTRDGFWLTDTNGVLLEANASYARISGYTVEELVGMHVSQLEAKEQPAEVASHLEKLVREGHDRFETRHRRKDGREIDIEISVTHLPEAQRFCVFCHDITARKQAELELQHRQELLNEAQRLGKLGSWELEVDSGVLRWSDEVYRIFELDPQYFSPCYETFLQLVHPDDRERVGQAYQQSLSDRQPYNAEHRLLFADERVKWVREHCTTTFDAAGRPLRSVGMVQDITERKAAEAEIRALALHDQLTGLPNRRFFLEQLPVVLSASLRHHQFGALLFIDMDNFKQLNDTLGHEAGDRMLKDVAGRLRASLRDVDMAFRFGGDEFVVLIEELGDAHDDALQRISLVAEKIRASLAEYRRHPVLWTGCIGGCAAAARRQRDVPGQELGSQQGVFLCARSRWITAVVAAS